MTLDYDAFKAFLITFLWRDGDAVVIANLDTLVQMANHELNRVLKVEDRTVTADVVATDATLTVPIDYREMRHLSSAAVGPMTYLTPAQFEAEAGRNAGGSLLPIFTVSNRLLRLSGGITPASPQTLTMVYYANVPDFKTRQESWVAKDYLDIYTYCCLKHSAPFLREDDRLQVWTNSFGAALQTALDENANRKYTGSPLKISYGGARR